MNNKVAFIIVLLFSCEAWADNGVVYIYEGRFSNTVAFRIDGDKIYQGRFDYPVKYRVSFNYIYDAQSNDVLYRIEDNLIRRGRLGNEVVARVEGNLILKGMHDPTVLFRVER